MDFLQNVLNDLVNTIEELTVRVMQTAENICENAEICICANTGFLFRRTQACMNNEGRHFEHLL
jgi:hypothetical protein